MRNTAILSLVMALFCACQHDIVRETHYNVTLDADNSYIAGEPVRFNIEGEVDNIVFYSGETGYQYENKGTSVVIKNMQNYLKKYEYTWSEPGTYKVTFVGTNVTYLHASEQVYDLSVTILEKI